MKKVISFIVVMALAFSMSVCAFAAERPTGDAVTPESLSAYYIEALNEEGADVSALAQEFVDDIGVFGEPTEMVKFVVELNTKVKPEVRNEFMAEVERIADVDLPDIPGLPVVPETSEPETSEPESSEESSTLEEDDNSGSGGSGGLGGFLGPIFGFIEDLVNDLLNPEEEDENDPWPSEPPTQEPSSVPSNPGDPTDPNGAGSQLSGGNATDAIPENESQVPNQGDTTVFAVATVALVAGAALVLTRKKSDDAE